MLHSMSIALALCSAVQAESLLTIPDISPRVDLAIQTHQICPTRPDFSVQIPKHIHSEHCTHNNPYVHPHNTSHPYTNTHNYSTSPTPKISPWSFHPTCTSNTTTQFCVFTSQTYLSNRGITLLTTPTIAHHISRIPAFKSPSHNHNHIRHSTSDDRDPPFTVQLVPGRGYGLIANRTIERAELIKAHVPIAILHNNAVTKEAPLYANHHAPLLYLAINQLPSPTHALFLSMAAHNSSEEPYIERIYTNTFGEDFLGHEHSIVIPETARLNHDCRPNAMYYFDAEKLVHYTVAARRVYKGEEITITYVDPLQTRRRRRAAVKRSWGFECGCSACGLGERFVRESNRRVVMINEILKVFGEIDGEGGVKDGKGKGKRGRKVGGSPEMAELLVGLYEQERLYASVADGYRIAALAYAAVGREHKAILWAMKAMEAGLIHDGPGGEGVDDMERLLKEPRRHWSWGLNL